MKWIAGSVALLQFFTNCVFAHSAETNVWAERRKTTQVARAEIPLPTLPAVGHLPQTFALPKRFSTANPAVVDLLSAIPASLGSVRKITPATNPKAPIVFHIQDIHQNTEAQKNISDVIAALSERGKIETVAMEGAFAPVDLAPFREFPDQSIVKRVADYLLREKEISGVMHAAFSERVLSNQFSVLSKNLRTNELGTENLQFIGVDDRSHYDANVEAYRAAAPLVNAEKKKLAAWKKDLAQRKFSVLSAQLSAFDSKVDAYRNGELSMGDYAEVICHREDEGRGDLISFLEAIRLERSLNFSQVESERGALLNVLTNKLSPAETNELIRASAAFRTGEIDNTGFYAYLRALCEKKNVVLARYPAMDAYLRYVLLSDSIDGEKLLADLRAAEDATYASLIKTPAERELLAESRGIYLTGKLLDFALTKEEWSEYKQVVLSNQFSVLSKKLRTDELRTENFKSFYKEAEIRDQKMAENVEKVLSNQFSVLSKNLITNELRTENSHNVSVLVTGGFHSAGIDRRLANAGATVITFVPQISKVEESSYLSVFAQKKTPLDQLFAGEKLFLNPEQSTVRQYRLASLLTACYAFITAPALVGAAQTLFRKIWGVAVVTFQKVSAQAVSVVVGKSRIQVRFKNFFDDKIEITLENIRDLSTRFWFLVDEFLRLIGIPELAPQLVREHGRGTLAQEFARPVLMAAKRKPSSNKTKKTDIEPDIEKWVDTLLTEKKIGDSIPIVDPDKKASRKERTPTLITKEVDGDRPAMLHFDENVLRDLGPTEKTAETVVSAYSFLWPDGVEKVGVDKNFSRSVEFPLAKPVEKGNQENTTMEVQGVGFNRSDYESQTPYLSPALGRYRRDDLTAEEKSFVAQNSIYIEYDSTGRLVRKPQTHSLLGGLPAWEAQKKYEHSVLINQMGLKGPNAVGYGTYHTLNKGEPMGVFMTLHPRQRAVALGRLIHKRIAILMAETEGDFAYDDIRASEWYQDRCRQLVEDLQLPTLYRLYGRALRDLTDKGLYPEQPHFWNMEIDRTSSGKPIWRWHDLGEWVIGDTFPPEQRFAYQYFVLTQAVTTATWNAMHDTVLGYFYRTGILDPGQDVVTGFFYDQLDNPLFSEDRVLVDIDQKTNNLYDARFRTTEDPIHLNLTAPFVPLMRQMYGFQTADENVPAMVANLRARVFFNRLVRPFLEVTEAAIMIDISDLWERSAVALLGHAQNINPDIHVAPDTLVLNGPDDIFQVLDRIRNELNEKIFVPAGLYMGGGDLEIISNAPLTPPSKDELSLRPANLPYLFLTSHLMTDVIRNKFGSRMLKTVKAISMILLPIEIGLMIGGLSSVATLPWYGSYPLRALILVIFVAFHIGLIVMSYGRPKNETLTGFALAAITVAYGVSSEYGLKYLLFIGAMQIVYDIFVIFFVDQHGDISYEIRETEERDIDDLLAFQPPIDQGNHVVWNRRRFRAAISNSTVIRDMETGKLLGYIALHIEGKENFKRVHITNMFFKTQEAGERLMEIVTKHLQDSSVVMAVAHIDIANGTEAKFLQDVGKFNVSEKVGQSRHSIYLKEGPNTALAIKQLQTREKERNDFFTALEFLNRVWWLRDEAEKADKPDANKGYQEKRLMGFYDHWDAEMDMTEMVPNPTAVQSWTEADFELRKRILIAAILDRIGDPNDKYGALLQNDDGRTLAECLAPLHLSDYAKSIVSHSRLAKDVDITFHMGRVYCNLMDLLDRKYPTEAAIRTESIYKFTAAQRKEFGLRPDKRGIEGNVIDNWKKNHYDTMRLKLIPIILKLMENGRLGMLPKEKRKIFIDLVDSLSLKTIFENRFIPEEEHSPIASPFTSAPAAIPSNAPNAIFRNIVLAIAVAIGGREFPEKHPKLMNWINGIGLLLVPLETYGLLWAANKGFESTPEKIVFVAAFFIVDFILGSVLVNQTRGAPLWNGYNALNTAVLFVVYACHFVGSPSAYVVYFAHVLLDANRIWPPVAPQTLPTNTAVFIRSLLMGATLSFAFLFAPTVTPAAGPLVTPIAAAVMTQTTLTERPEDIDPPSAEPQFAPYAKDAEHDFIYYSYDYHVSKREFEQRVPFLKAAIKDAKAGGAKRIVLFTEMSPQRQQMTEMLGYVANSQYNLLPDHLKPKNAEMLGLSRSEYESLYEFAKNWTLLARKGDVWSQTKLLQTDAGKPAVAAYVKALYHNMEGMGAEGSKHGSFVKQLFAFAEANDLEIEYERLTPISFYHQVLYDLSFSQLLAALRSGDFDQAISCSKERQKQMSLWLTARWQENDRRIIEMKTKEPGVAILSLKGIAHSGEEKSLRDKGYRVTVDRTANVRRMGPEPQLNLAQRLEEKLPDNLNDIHASILIHWCLSGFQNFNRMESRVEDLIVHRMANGADPFSGEPVLPPLTTDDAKAIVKYFGEKSKRGDDGDLPTYYWLANATKEWMKANGHWLPAYDKITEVPASQEPAAKDVPKEKVEIKNDNNWFWGIALTLGAIGVAAWALLGKKTPKKQSEEKSAAPKDKTTKKKKKGKGGAAGLLLFAVLLAQTAPTLASQTPVAPNPVTAHVQANLGAATNLHIGEKTISAEEAISNLYHSPRVGDAHVSKSDLIANKRLQLFVSAANAGQMKDVLAIAVQADVYADDSVDANILEYVTALRAKGKQISLTASPELFNEDGTINENAFDGAVARIRAQQKLSNALFVLPNSILVQLVSNGATENPAFRDVAFVRAEDFLSHLPMIAVLSLGLAIQAARAASRHA